MSQVRNLAHLKDPSNKFLFIVGDVRGDKKKVLLAEHHIYCFPSLCEGMPNSVLEAMAFGMPVVTCPTGGLKDFFVEGKMGYLVKSGSSRDIADVLEKLIDEEGGIIRISSFNHRYAQKKFLSPMTATFMNEVYQEVYLRTSLQSTPES